MKKNNFSTKSSTYPIVYISNSTYKIYKLLVTKQLSNKGIKEELGYKAHSTISHHTKKLINWGVIICINPQEKVKFYRPVSGVKVVPGKIEKQLKISSSSLGRVPDEGLRVEKNKYRCRDRKTGRFIKSRRKNVGIKRSYDTIASIGSKRLPVCRVHSKTYIAPVTGGPIDDVKWDHVSSPNDRFKQFDISWPVPDIGVCTFRWIKSKKKSELVIFLPERYLLPHELQHEAEILEQLAWQAATWFSKNAMRLKRRKAKRWRIGIGLLVQYRPTHYAFEASSVQQDFIKNKGMVKTETKGGMAWLDNSLKDVGEVEFTSRDEAVISLDMPGEIKKNRDWINSFENNFSHFIDQFEKQNKIQIRDSDEQKKKWDEFYKLQSKRNENQEKRWYEQNVFNARILKRLEEKQSDSDLDKTHSNKIAEAM